MIRASSFSWQSVQWTRALLWGGGSGLLFGFLVGSAAFRWGLLSGVGTVFIALLLQPPLVGLLLVGERSSEVCFWDADVPSKDGLRA